MRYRKFEGVLRRYQRIYNGFQMRYLWFWRDCFRSFEGIFWDLGGFQVASEGCFRKFRKCFRLKTSNSFRKVWGEEDLSEGLCCVTEGFEED